MRRRPSSWSSRSRRPGRSATRAAGTATPPRASPRSSAPQSSALDRATTRRRRRSCATRTHYCVPPPPSSNTRRALLGAVARSRPSCAAPRIGRCHLGGRAPSRRRGWCSSPLTQHQLPMPSKFFQFLLIPSHSFPFLLIPAPSQSILFLPIPSVPSGSFRFLPIPSNSFQFQLLPAPSQSIRILPIASASSRFPRLARCGSPSAIASDCFCFLPAPSPCQVRLSLGDCF